MERPYSKGWFTEYGIFKKYFFARGFWHLFIYFIMLKLFFWLVHKMEQGFSCSTPAFRNTDILEGICRKKSNVISNLFPLGCDGQ